MYESSLVILTGVSIAVAITFLSNYLQRVTIDDFRRDYAAALTRNQASVAEQYYDKFPLQDLLDAVDAEYASIGCHIQGHGIGRIVYRKDQNFSSSVQKCGGSCTYGCFHGVLMEMFQTESDTLGGVIEEEAPDAYLEHMKAIAKDLCTKPEVESVVRVRQCYHGLGHMFVYSMGGDLKRATDSCDEIFSEDAARSCRTGAFMEYIFSDTSPTVEYAKSTKPCDAFPGDEYICYRYKGYSWLYVYKTIEAAMKACDSLGVHALDCISGTASAAATPELLATAEGIETICGFFEGEKRRKCLGGAFLSIINLNHGDDSEHQCDIIAPSFRDGCLGVREKYRQQIFYDE